MIKSWRRGTNGGIAPFSKPPGKEMKFNIKSNVIYLVKLFEILCLMLIGFFIVVTGVHTLPLVVEFVREGSYVPLVYSLSICAGYIYFFFIKPIKLISEYT